MGGRGRQWKLHLKQCEEEAESAGSNPLSGAQIIITTVCQCLCACSDYDDSVGVLDLLSVGLHASNRPQ